LESGENTGCPEPLNDSLNRDSDSAYQDGSPSLAGLFEPGKREESSALFDSDCGNPRQISATLPDVAEDNATSAPDSSESRQISGSPNASDAPGSDTSALACSEDFGPSQLLFYFEMAGVDTTDLVDDDPVHILAALRKFVALPADARVVSQFHDLLTDLYPRDVPPEYVELVLGKVLEMLGELARSTVPLPRLLAEAAAALPLNQPGACDVSVPELVFDRGDTVDPDILALEWNLTFTHVPFRRFIRGRRAPVAAKGPATVPNFKTIAAAIRFTAMPSPQLEAQRKQLIDLLKNFEKERVVLLFTGLGMKMKAVYRMERDSTLRKIWGAGPAAITEDDVETFWKYITGAKQMERIPTKHFTQTTDCICLKAGIERRHW
jgi:hypothetical protein